MSLYHHPDINTNHALALDAIVFSHGDATTQGQLGASKAIEVLVSNYLHAIYMCNTVLYHTLSNPPPSTLSWSVEHPSTTKQYNGGI